MEDNYKDACETPLTLNIDEYWFCFPFLTLEINIILNRIVGHVIKEVPVSKKRIFRGYSK